MSRNQNSSSFRRVGLVLSAAIAVSGLAFTAPAYATPVPPPKGPLAAGHFAYVVNPASTRVTRGGGGTVSGSLGRTS